MFCLLQKNTKPSYQRIYTCNDASYDFVISAVLGHRMQSATTHRAGTDDAKGLGIVRLPFLVAVTCDQDYKVAVHGLLCKIATYHDFCFWCKAILSHLLIFLSTYDV